MTLLPIALPHLKLEKRKIEQQQQTAMSVCADPKRPCGPTICLGHTWQAPPLGSLTRHAAATRKKEQV